MAWKKLQTLLILFLILLRLFNTSVVFAEATTTDVLKSKIEERNNQIKQLEQEINQYNTEVLKAGSEANTLQNTIKTLDLTKKKITTDISLTQNKITKTSLTIEETGNEINKTQENINTNEKALINALRTMDSIEDAGVVMIVLSNKTIGDMWTDLDNIRQIHGTIQDKTKELAILKNDMESKQKALLSEKNNLLGLKQDLDGKKQAVEYTAKEKANLLSQTKNKEATYKQLVKTKEEQKAQFEKEVFDYESQLNILVDKGSYPAPKKGILSWPLDSVFITQMFGKTVGAEKLYTSGSHNGVDFRATIGTKVKNVLAGDVVGTGNTDQYPGCYSFGKWVMVRHDNGLSTIYAHLSVISVTTGQRLSTGDLIGYSGNTGYSTGPHLHISVYATEGVRITQFVNSIGCKQAVLPLADVKAYLDPLAYFPAL